MLITAYQTVTVSGKDDTGWILEGDERIEFANMHDPELEFDAGQQIKIAQIGGLVYVLD